MDERAVDGYGMSKEFDSYAQTYQAAIERSTKIFGQKHAFFVRDKVERLLDAFIATGPLKSLKVLDVGCGIGLGHGEIAQAVGELHGVDVSRDSLALATRDNPSVNYKTYEGKRLPHENNAFDCAYAICVLHHLPKQQWPEFMREMARVVRPGGQLVVIEHNPLNPATQWVVRTCELDKNAMLLPPWRLHRLFIDAGLSAPQVRYTLFTPFAQKFFRALDRALSRIPIGAQYIVAGRKAERPDR